MTFHQVLNKINRRDTHFLPKNFTFFKIIIIFLVILTISFSVKTILAQNTNTNQTSAGGNIIKAKQDAISKGNNQESWLNEAMGSNLMSTIQMMTGEIPFNNDGSINFQSYIPGGAIGITNNMISTLYNHPVSGVEYIAQVKNSFLGKPVYAQDTGFQGLQPLLPLWRTLRNITYVFASLVFVVIGIMIMLRIKISPQAVITLQSSIPKIITALIFITFSYAIAGLIIDFSNLLLSICLAIFFTAKGVNTTESLFSTNIFSESIKDSGGFIVTSWLGNAVMTGINQIQDAFGVSPYNLTNIANGGFGKIYDLTTKAIPAASGIVLGQIAGQIFLGVILGGAGSLVLGDLGSSVLGSVGSGVGNVLGGVLGALLIPVILSIMIVIWLIKLYFGLLKCYITLIFQIIIGPLQIAMGAIPNSKIGFSSWITNIVANISVFPITILFLVFINYLTDIFSGGGLWAPSQLSMVTLGGNAKVVAAGIGLAGLGMLAKLPKLIPEVIFQLKPSPFGTAIGEAYKLPTSVAIAGAKEGTADIAEKLENNMANASSPSSVTKILGWIGKTTSKSLRK